MDRFAQNSAGSLGAAPNTPNKKGLVTMSEFIFFTIGFLIGTLGGITAMCIVQINRLNDTKTKNKEDF